MDMGGRNRRYQRFSECDLAIEDFFSSGWFSTAALKTGQFDFGNYHLSI